MVLTWCRMCMGWIVNTLSVSREFSMFEWLLLKSQHKIQHHHLHLWLCAFLLIYSFQMLEIVIKLNCMMIKTICVQCTGDPVCFFLKFYHHHFLELCDKWQAILLYYSLLIIIFIIIIIVAQVGSSVFSVQSKMSLPYDYDYNFTIQLRINKNLFELEFCNGFASPFCRSFASILRF